MSKTIDLSLCQKRDNCELRNGSVVRFEGREGTDSYPYVAGGRVYTRTGRWAANTIEDDLDIVRVTRNGVQVTGAAISGAIIPEKCLELIAMVRERIGQDGSTDKTGYANPWFAEIRELADQCVLEA